MKPKIIFLIAFYVFLFTNAYADTINGIFCVRNTGGVVNFRSRTTCLRGERKLDALGLQGETGPAGPQGPTGSQGPTGPQGPAGTPAPDAYGANNSAPANSVYVDSNGEVGIGTNTPTSDLTIYDNSNFANIEILGTGTFPALIRLGDTTSDNSYYWGLDKRNIFGTNSTYNFTNIIQHNDLNGIFGWSYIVGVDNSVSPTRVNQVLGDPYGDRPHKIQFNAATDVSTEYPAFLFNEINPGSTNDILRIQKSGIRHLTMLSNGNVGIGNSSPSQKLHIQNVMRIEPTDSPGACNSTQTGSIYYDNSLAEPCHCNGTSWIQFDGGGNC